MKPDNTYVLQQLQQQFGAALIGAGEPYGLLTVELEPSQLVPVVQWLRDHPEFPMNFLTDITGIHYPENPGKEIGAIYHLHCLVHNLRVRIKCFMPAAQPEIESLTGLFAGANWMERETYDFFGIIFRGHPDLRRILNADEMDYFPLRKEYPLEDGTRTDKEDKYFGR